MIAFLARLVQSVAGTEARRGWQLAFEDLFTRDDLGTDWLVVEGEWQARYSAGMGDAGLYGAGEIFLNWRFPGDVLVEFVASSNDPGDFSAIICAGKGGRQGPHYFLGFGTQGNKHSVIQRNGRQVDKAPDVITAGRSHKVVAVKQDNRVALIVDGNAICEYMDKMPVEGLGQDRVGLYVSRTARIEAFRVYVRPDVKAVKIPLPPSQRTHDLICNGSFEDAVASSWPMMPRAWIDERSGREDRVELVTDPASAHSGRRFVALGSPGAGVKLHNLKDGNKAVEYEYGQTYRIALWLRALDGARPKVTVEPGHGEFEPTPEWSRYALEYTYPEKQPELGFFIRVGSGVVAVDDVSIVPANKRDPSPTPPLTECVAKPAWLMPGFSERFAVRVENRSQNDSGLFPVANALWRVMPAHDYRFLSVDKLAVFDALSGKAVQWVLLEADRSKAWQEMEGRLTQGDEIVFVGEVPAYSAKTYHIYLRNRAFVDVERPLELPVALPASWKIPADAIDRLDEMYWEVARGENVSSISALYRSGVLSGRLRCAGAVSAEAKAISPDGVTMTDVPLVKNMTEPRFWEVAPDFRMSPDVPEGVWKLRGVFTTATDGALRIETPFVVGCALSWQHNFQLALPGEAPQYGSAPVKLAAAGNEWEAFQLVLSSERTLHEVELAASPLVRSDGAVLSSDVFRFDQVVPVYNELACDGTNRAGWTPDPLLPWRKFTVEPRENAVAWATVRVPTRAKAGRYAGTITATESSGMTLSIPVELRVFDFSLPAEKHWTCGVSAKLDPSLWPAGYRPVEGFKKNSEIAPFFFVPRNTSYAETRADADRLLLESRMEPRYAPTIPWYYDPEANTATYEFGEYDDYTRRHLSLGGSYIWISFWNGIHSNNHKPQMIRDNAGHSAMPDTPEGVRMYRAWLTGILAHLKDMGWSERALFYFGHEVYTPQMFDLAANGARTVHELAPEALTYTTSGYKYFGGAWQSFCEAINLWFGDLGPFQKRFLDQPGLRKTGRYNRKVYLGNPVAIARTTAAQWWAIGQEIYLHWDIALWERDPWVSSRFWNGVPYHSGQRAGYACEQFLVSESPREPKFGTLIYPWPEWVPRKAEDPAVLTSVRLEALREGAEDYEYFWMLRGAAKGPMIAVQQKLDQRLREILRAAGDKQARLDPAAYMELREDFGEAIEKAISGR
ncbi:MAG: hypothetical protein V2A58_01955 [Planctomycetota bacterium]